MVRVSTRPPVISLVAAATDVLPVQGVEGGVHAGLVAEHRPQEMRVLDLARVAGVVPVACIASAVTTAPRSGSGSSSGLKCVTSFAFPDLATLFLADDQPGDVGDRPKQVHLLLPAGLGELAFLAVHRHRHPGRDVTGVAGDRRVQPRVAGCRPEPAAGPGLAQRVRGMWLAPLRAAVCCRAAARAAAARDCAAGSSAAPATSPVSAASSSSGSR